MTFFSCLSVKNSLPKFVQVFFNDLVCIDTDVLYLLISLSIPFLRR